MYMFQGQLQSRFQGQLQSRCQCQKKHRSPSVCNFNSNSLCLKYSKTSRPSMSASELPPAAGNPADVQLRILEAIKELATGMQTIGNTIQDMRQEGRLQEPLAHTDQSHLQNLDLLALGGVAYSGNATTHGMSSNTFLTTSGFNPGPPVNDTDYLVPHWRLPANYTSFQPGINFDVGTAPVPSTHANNFVYPPEFRLPMTAPNSVNAPLHQMPYGAHSMAGLTEFAEGSSGGKTRQETEDKWEDDFPSDAE